ncbi:hypothetical protein [Sodalis sp. dw_96]|uniref:hypothetical protein n=1 Tax=Sodalis sp. dw_96 TaxID=2719794 RepID=UPI001BD3913A|nr:hypothetical protein [Sodalis sp. dw_96]
MKSLQRGLFTRPSSKQSIGYMRVVGQGGAYIPSEEIAQLPEVKDMQRMAAEIVKKDLATLRK